MSHAKELASSTAGCRLREQWEQCSEISLLVRSDMQGNVKSERKAGLKAA